MIEQILERIAEAVEGIEAKLGVIVHGLAEPDDAEDIVTPVPVSVDAEKPAVAQSPYAETREDLLAGCRVLGIEVPKGTRTATLRKWIAEVEHGRPDTPIVSPPVCESSDTSAQPAIDVSAQPVELPGPEGSPAYTRDDVRKALISLCREILTSYGAASISELEEDNFSAVIAQIESLRKGA